MIITKLHAIVIRIPFIRTSPSSRSILFRLLTYVILYSSRCFHIIVFGDYFFRCICKITYKYIIFQLIFMHFAQKVAFDFHISPASISGKKNISVILYHGKAIQLQLYFPNENHHNSDAYDQNFAFILHHESA